MSAGENILAQILVLRDEGRLPRSACGATLRRTLQPLLSAGVVAEERVGGGRCLVVRDPRALREFIRSHFPDTPPSESLPSRAAGVARFRDSKTFASDTPEILSVRAWSENALWKEERPAAAAAATAQHGVFSFLLADASPYSLRGACALVENPAVFTRFEQLRLPVGLVIYGRGRASRRLVNWLAAMTAPDFRLLHLPDYDPAGLTEFDRLRRRLGERAALHLPPALDDYFERFSNRALLERGHSQAMLAGLRASACAEIRRVVGLIDRHNAGLEQEALLLPLPRGGAGLTRGACFQA